MKSISVIMPLFNKGLYIEETIRSVLSQTFTEWELIVVDNESTDKGADIVRSFLHKEPRIRLVTCLKRGPGAARNFGLTQAKGDWILFLDADDLLESNYFEERLSVVSQANEADLIVGYWEDFFDGQFTNRCLRKPVGWGKPIGIVNNAAFAYAPWALHAAVIRRQRLDRLWPCWKEDLDLFPSEDTAFWFPVIYNAKIIWTDHAGALYRKHSNNSRDLGLKIVETSFNASRRILKTNLAFLASIGKKPSPQQAANTVRMLRAMLSKVDKNTTIVQEMCEEIRYWLRYTSYSDPRMLYRRLQFAEPRLP